ncbi:MAG: efflux RND transporter periplasmic adaptor subunit [Azonexus sp.]|jgi:HlyD family secretion protein|uniref:efflux RND transporter periplasmic adaptor subunit n=1 Tax=Azonexus sp. TaxID=1872668 RepID=UPI002831CD68|nr:efflux RND transporter periplasmic adaptor subunit [Azonexus sp.]MDR0776541.1 efflux RND transporter periplasmic adaptor subunit [Azonexus sp.]
MKRSSKVVLWIVVTATLAGGVAWWFQQRSAQNPERRYRLAAIERGDITQLVSANGTLNPVVLVSVGTQVSGTVKQLYVDFNDPVKKDQVLLELDDALVAAAERQSAASVVSARASLDLAQANESRIKVLYAQEFVSSQEYDQAEQALKAAGAQLALARAQNDRDRANLGFTVIRSPVDGVVVDRVVDLGQTVAASFQTPTLIKIAQDLSEMCIDTSFAEADIGLIREGQKVRFTVDAFPNRSFAGAVQQIRLNPTNQQNVVTYNVRINVANPELILLPGMTAYVNIAVQQRDDALLVPNAALRFKPAEPISAPPSPDAAPQAGGPSGAEAPPAAPEGGGARAGAGKGKKRDGQSGTVFVLRGGALQPVNVQLGITDNRSTELLGGDLQVGDRVVTGENSTPARSPSSVGMRMF